MMACHGLCAKTFSEPMLAFCEMIHWEQISVKLNENTTFFIQQNELKNIVCNVEVILSWTQYLNSRHIKMPPTPFWKLASRLRIGNKW